jgi:hypothetical protein
VTVFRKHVGSTTSTTLSAASPFLSGALISTNASLEAYFASLLADPNARRALLSVLHDPGATGGTWSQATFHDTRMSSTSPIGGTLAAIIDYVDRELEHHVSMFERVDYTPAPEYVPAAWIDQLNTVVSTEDEGFVLDWDAEDDEPTEDE